MKKYLKSKPEILNKVKEKYKTMKDPFIYSFISYNPDETGVYSLKIAERDLLDERSLVFCPAFKHTKNAFPLVIRFVIDFNKESLTKISVDFFKKDVESYIDRFTLAEKIKENIGVCLSEVVENDFYDSSMVYKESEKKYFSKVIKEFLEN